MKWILLNLNSLPKSLEAEATKHHHTPEPPPRINSSDSSFSRPGDGERWMGSLTEYRRSDP